MTFCNSTTTTKANVHPTPVLQVPQHPDIEERQDHHVCVATSGVHAGRFYALRESLRTITTAVLTGYVLLSWSVGTVYLIDRGTQAVASVRVKVK